jgi:hypothetical protein
VKVEARVWVPDGLPGPGRLEDVELDVVRSADSMLELPGVVVEDVRGDAGLDRGGDIRVGHGWGGGPLTSPKDREQARAFGIVNVAFFLARARRYVEGLTGRSLPRLVTWIGVHDDNGARPWGGGHYRLPAETYSSFPESLPPAPEGEIHLGPGRRYAKVDGEPYFLAPAHNAAIVCHEFGHHVTRHTADFRLNRLRPPHAQGNHKTPLDEGTADYLAAVLLDTPDIYGWHRASIASSRQDRRRLDVVRTMAEFRGGSDQDPHTDGTVWASALWAARCAVAAVDEPHAFDEIVLDALIRIGDAPVSDRREEDLRRRRYFSRALEALLAAADARGGRHVSTIAEVLASRGIEVGASNAELRDRCRRTLGAREPVGAVR